MISAINTALFVALCIAVSYLAGMLVGYASGTLMVLHRVSREYGWRRTWRAFLEVVLKRREW